MLKSAIEQEDSCPVDIHRRENSAASGDETSEADVARAVLITWRNWPKQYSSLVNAPDLQHEILCIIFVLTPHNFFKYHAFLFQVCYS